MWSNRNLFLFLCLAKNQRHQTANTVNKNYTRNGNYIVHDIQLFIIPKIKIDCFDLSFKSCKVLYIGLHSFFQEIMEG